MVLLYDLTLRKASWDVNELKEERVLLFLKRDLREALTILSSLASPFFKDVNSINLLGFSDQIKQRRVVADPVLLGKMAKLMKKGGYTINVRDYSIEEVNS